MITFHADIPQITPGENTPEVTPIGQLGPLVGRIGSKVKVSTIFQIFAFGIAMHSAWSNLLGKFVQGGIPLDTVDMADYRPDVKRDFCV